eukprot:TRINITY_DN38394_c0_g1_i1.p1 TRINITY_DN38394_c0_g1~~TRINITY_DN38394_c0_g1_i1.p1  ORF type:complete len:401 (+),score=58.51 TRINITY_DN38394_c0_g1_i1:87-1205(+)
MRLFILLCAVLLLGVSAVSAPTQRFQEAYKPLIRREQGREKPPGTSKKTPSPSANESATTQEDPTGISALEVTVNRIDRFFFDGDVFWEVLKLYPWVGVLLVAFVGFVVYTAFVFGQAIISASGIDCAFCICRGLVWRKLLGCRAGSRVCFDVLPIRSALEKATLPEHHVRPSKVEDQSYIVFPKLLSSAEIARVHKAGQSSSSVLCKDRDYDLDYKHVAYRIEHELSSKSHGLYSRLMELMVQADASQWGVLAQYTEIFPEIEYIRYDGRPTADEHAVSPHVDNCSALTLVCLVSDPDNFEGGALCLDSAAGTDPQEMPSLDQPPRREKLEMGDAVLFRGESLLHWVEPVTSGTRIVLQIELTRDGGHPPD